MTNRYFIAIVPPEPLQSELMNWKKRLSSSYNTIGALRSPAHITLHMPFEMGGQKEKKFLSAAEKLVMNTAPFVVRLNGFGGFEPRVIFIDVVLNEQLSQIRNETVEWMKTTFHIFNQSDDRRGFHPHVTLAFRDLRKLAYYKAFEEVRAQNFEKEFSCENVRILKFKENRWETEITIPFKEMSEK